MSQSLTQEQKAIQRQIATQQTIRLMQLVELPYISLEQEIHREVDENPALEVYSDDVDDRHQDREDDYSDPAEYDDNGNPLELQSPLTEHLCRRIAMTIWMTILQSVI